MEGAMDRRNALRLLRRHGPLVGVLTLAGLLAAISVLLLQLRQVPQHQATTSLFASAYTSADLAQGAAVAENPSGGPLPGVSGIAKSPSVLQPVVDELGLPVTAAQLAERVSITWHAEATVLDVTVADDSAARAARIADAVADRLASMLPQLV